MAQPYAKKRRSMHGQIVAKKRVADHGEVYTREREVDAMLDLVKSGRVKDCHAVIG